LILNRRERNCDVLSQVFNRNLFHAAILLD